MTNTPFEMTELQKLEKAVLLLEEQVATNKSMSESYLKELELAKKQLREFLKVSLVHPKKYIEKIFSNIPKKGLIGVEKEPYADTMLCTNSKNAIKLSLDDEDGLDDLIKELVENKYRFRKTGIKNRTYLNANYSWQNIAAKYFENFKV